MLFLYAVAFSFAYLSLSAGTGALILFGVVQATMILAGLLSGERPHVLQWAGLLIAVAGLVYLVFPGLSAPSPLGAALMALAGVAWGIYSLRGREARDPIAATAHNFIYSVPLVLGASVLMRTHVHLSVKGVLLALVSGALTSGLGYILWYAALRGLTATRAALVQLVVPVLAAVGGVLFLSESITLRLFISAVAILGGVILAMSVNGQVLRLNRKTQKS
jgi:drug/metabolite transporter (DMT)-like permease